VALVAGTDGWAGLGLHRELEVYVRAGIPAADALRIATWGAARHAGAQASHGRIASGMVADLVLIDGDPLAEITALRRASLVVQGRVAYRPAQVYDALGLKPFVAGAAIDTAEARP
jgi:imidazolonepropionase-like amidohydrolase